MGDVIDRRATIEAALEGQEEVGSESGAGATSAAAPEPPPYLAPEEETPAPASESPAPPPPGSKPEPSPAPAEPGLAVDKAPQSWRMPQKAKWDKLEPDIRQEIMRRERETTKVLGESATARQLAGQFNQMVQPYQARITSMGMEPLGAINELLKADYVLSTAPKAQRAAYMAKLISEYDVDILELDSALAGKGAADPVDARVEALLQQRLAPFQQYINNQQRQAANQERQSAQEVSTSIEAMSNDGKYPFFQELRLDMADAIDLAAKRGLYLSLDQAYNRAIAMNPEVNKQVADQRNAEARKSAAQTANSRAQRALNASVSVGGAPGGVPSGASGATDRRATIAAAFDSLGGR